MVLQQTGREISFSLVRLCTTEASQPSETPQRQTNNEKDIAHCQEYHNLVCKGLPECGLSVRKNVIPDTRVSAEPSVSTLNRSSDIDTRISSCDDRTSQWHVAADHSKRVQVQEMLQQILQSEYHRLLEPYGAAASWCAAFERRKSAAVDLR